VDIAVLPVAAERSLAVLRFLVPPFQAVPLDLLFMSFVLFPPEFNKTQLVLSLLVMLPLIVSA
jgi:hypothetical protein